MSAPTLTTIMQTASQVKVPAPWLKREAQAQRVPHLRVGRRLRFNVDAVRRHLADRAAREGLANV